LIKIIKPKNLQPTTRNGKFIIQGENPMSENQNTRDNQNEQILALLQTLTADMQDVKLRLNSLENNLVYFASRLQALEEKVDQKLYNTRPIWESVLSKLDSIESRLERLETSLDVVKADVIVVKADVETLKEAQSQLNKDFQDFKDSIDKNFKGLEKDINFYHKKAQIDVISFAKDLALLETRLEKVEIKLQSQN
jgi:chromosome segregation ATPase